MKHPHQVLTLPAVNLHLRCSDNWPLKLQHSLCLSNFVDQFRSKFKKSSIPKFKCFVTIQIIILHYSIYKHSRIQYYRILLYTEKPFSSEICHKSKQNEKKIIKRPKLLQFLSFLLWKRKRNCLLYPSPCFSVNMAYVTKKKTEFFLHSQKRISWTKLFKMGKYKINFKAWWLYITFFRKTFLKDGFRYEFSKILDDRNFNAIVVKFQN